MIPPPRIEHSLAIFRQGERDTVVESNINSAKKGRERERVIEKIWMGDEEHLQTPIKG